MQKPKGGFISFIVFILFAIVLPYSIFVGDDRSDEYEQRGKLVHCTVTSVSKMGKRQYVQGTYRDENDDLITADITANKRVSLSDELDGYVLPEKPDKVYCPAGDGLKLAVYILGGVFALTGWGIVILQIVIRRKHRLLFKKGIPGRAEIVENPQKCGDNYSAKMRFVTNDGQEFIKEFVFTKHVPSPGNQYSIVYYVKKNGRCIADVIEL